MTKRRYLSAEGFLAEETEEGGAALLRASGDSPTLSVPETICGLRVTEIGAYCFARERRLSEEAEALWKTETKREPGRKEICGEALLKLELPDSVEKMGDCALYNCKNMTELVVGRKMQALGSDVFMNCGRLGTIKIRGSVRQGSGLGQIVSRIPSTVEAVFSPDGETEAVVLYPEFLETYDEIAPAHLFGRNITGEGFRARQCFRDGKIDFAAYDGIFPKVCAEESREIAERLSLNRLRYPVDLKEEAGASYGRYIRQQQANVGKRLIQAANLDALQFLCKGRYFSVETVALLVAAAADAGWTEGAANLLKWKNEWYQTGQKERYSFDEF